MATTSPAVESTNGEQSWSHAPSPPPQQLLQLLLLQPQPQLAAPRSPSLTISHYRGHHHVDHHAPPLATTTDRNGVYSPMIGLGVVSFFLIIPIGFLSLLGFFHFFGMKYERFFTKGMLPYIFTFMLMSWYVNPHTHTSPLTRTHARTHARTHTHTRARHTHTHTHTHTHD
jgi:hypothetical protein